MLSGISGRAKRPLIPLTILVAVLATLLLGGLVSRSTNAYLPTGVELNPGQPEGCSQGAWTAMAPAPSAVARYGYAQNGDDFYVVAGIATYKYSVSTNTWTTLAARPRSLLAPAVVYHNNKLYSVGGYDDDPNNELFIYDIPTNTWTEGANLPVWSYGANAAGVHNDRIYAMSGTSGNSLIVYDIATNTWTIGTPPPSSYFLGGNTQVGQYLYLVGSLFGSGANATQRFDMASGTWSVGPTWTPRRGNFALASDGAKLYAMGGRAAGSSETSAEVYQLSLADWPNGQWVRMLPDLPSPREGNQAGFSTQGRIWSTGGYRGVTNLAEHLYLNIGPCGTATATPTLTPTVMPTSTSTPTLTPICGSYWSVVSSPNPSSTLNGLEGIAALAPNDVWAVGAYDTITAARSLALHWDGSLWTHIATPNRGSDVTNNILLDVEGVASNDVWAVGYYDAGGGGQLKTLTQHWDGTQWSIIPSADYITTTNALRSVSALSSNDVWAVGYYLESGYARTLVGHWDGTQWSIVPSPNTGTDAEFWGVSALAPNNVWAVGHSLAINGDRYTLVQHWDGTQWSIVPSPGDGYYNALYGVAAIAPNDVWMVGHYQSQSGSSGTLVVHWNGSQLSVVPSPNLGPRFNHLLDIAVIAPKDLWAVGYYCCNPGSPSLTLAMHWDGTAWSVVTTPNPGSANNSLWGVDAFSTGDVWAIGYIQHCGGTGCPWTTLTEHYSYQCITATPIPPTATITPTPTITPTITLTSTVTDTPTITNTPIYTHTPSVTDTPTITDTPTSTRTTTPCPMTFTDVQPTDYFYEAVRYLYCAGVISGYSDNTFRPFNTTTRGQLCKIIVLAEGWTINSPPNPTFSDVPTGNPFYGFIETAHSHNIISGYSDGTFRPGNDVTRGQLCKIIVLAEEWTVSSPPTPTFTDVPSSHPFYVFIETAYLHNIISGYSDGTFRPANNATRGQICKIVYSAVTQTMDDRRWTIDDGRWTMDDRR